MPKDTKKPETKTPARKSVAKKSTPKKPAPKKTPTKKPTKVAAGGPLRSNARPKKVRKG